MFIISTLSFCLRQPGKPRPRARVCACRFGMPGGSDAYVYNKADRVWDSVRGGAIFSPPMELERSRVWKSPILRKPWAVCAYSNPDPGVLWSFLSLAIGPPFLRDH